jgi:hypothetical protein
MRTALLVLVLATSYFSTSFASINAADKGKTYNFVFNGPKQSFQIEQAGSTFEEAFDKAAQSCMIQMRGNATKLSEDQKMDIVDTCANPHTS